MTASPRLQVLSPVAVSRTATRSIAPRLPSLEGRMLGLWDNGKANNDVFQARVAEILQDRFADIRLVSRVRPITLRTARDAAEHLTAELGQTCDAVLVSMSD